jgi:hypothetical protein
MNRHARIARATVKARATATRAARRAHRAVATGTPQPAKTHLIAAGLDPLLAKRFAGAFSQRVNPTATGETVVKLKGRVTKRVSVKLYNLPAFAARLAVYRPKDRAAAAAFHALVA